MLKHSRVSKHIDIGGLSRAVARPGIDTRTWTSLAIVTAVTIDPTEGVFADVLLLPSEDTYCARVGAIYAGPGFGLYAPLEVDDEVVVEAPSGDPQGGVVITHRLHSPSDPPPPEIAARSTDFLLLAKENTTVRIATQGSGDVVIDARGTGKVKLGAEELNPLTAGVMTGESISDFSGLPYSASGQQSSVVLAKKGTL